MKKILLVMMALCCVACAKVEQVEQVEQKTLDENQVGWWMQETEIEIPKTEAFPKDAILTEAK
ncbi:MAG: hypothetical protein J6R32_03305 [Bacteroidales bacterium]|nr:hypothetical protein [Bacteroidales bacterium]